MDEKKAEVDYKFGTMIEIPRAAVTAAEIAGPDMAEFFSFGTNDLTQMTFGYSRDDAERNFLLKYVEEGILPFNPFQTIDREGVGRLMDICVQEGRQGPPGPRGRHLWRARRRPQLHRVVPPDRQQLRELLSRSVCRWPGSRLRRRRSSTRRRSRPVDW